MFIKLGLRELSPFIMVFSRLAVSSLFMLLACRFTGAALPSERRIWLSLGFLGIVNTGLPFFLVAWAQQHIDTATASILNATSPVFIMILAHFFTDDEKLTLRKAIGVSAGIAGIIVMVMPSITHGIVLAGMAQAAMLALFCTGIAFIIYYRIIASAGATNAILVTLMIPVSALFFGAFLMGEQLKIYDIVGMLLIFSGLLIIDGRILLNLSRKRELTAGA